MPGPYCWMVTADDAVRVGTSDSLMRAKYDVEVVLECAGFCRFVATIQAPRTAWSFRNRDGRGVWERIALEGIPRTKPRILIP